jgi:ATP phosphoribosyltransferase regulatory subunit
LPKEKKKLLHIPQGTESFYLEEAFVHRRLRETLLDLFHAWGYLPVQTPVFDFFDTYRGLLDAEATDKIYRLIDREGDLLMLRSDNTLFMAKQMGLALTREDLPVRVCYADSILRHQDREDISHNEFFQVGAELIGKDGLDGDLEVLMLLLATIEHLRLPRVVLHLGSHGFFTTCFAARNISAAEEQLIHAAIYNRSFGDAREILETSGFSAAEIELMKRLFAFIGTVAEFSALEKEVADAGLLPRACRQALAYLAEVGAQLEGLDAASRVRIDLSEIGGQPYYTGLVFQIYMPGMDTAVASGGRYNRLLGYFGFDAPSCGFSLLLRKVQEKIGNPERFKPERRSINVRKDDFAAAYRAAEKLRAQGRIVTLQDRE